MKKRLHDLKLQLYERFMRFMARHFGPVLEHVNDEPFTVLWQPASAHFCPHCDWTYMIWDVGEHCWKCPQCGIECHPPLAITEKRPVVRVVEAPRVTPKGAQAAVPLRRTGDLARAHEHKQLIPVGDGPVRRLQTRDGRTITTDELKAYPHVRREKTG